MKKLLSMEFERLLIAKAKFLVPLCILLAALFFVDFGADEFDKFEERQDGFTEVELDKTSRCLTYDQMGAKGFRLLYRPGPLIVFFETHKLLKNTESQIDASEVLNVSEVYKGRNIFIDGNYIDFSGLIYIFGSLYMAFMGLFNFRENQFANLYMTKKHAAASILVRLTILNALFILIFTLTYLYAHLIKGISFTPTETGIYIDFCLFALLFLTAFYGLGLAVSWVRKSLKKITLAVIWFIFIFGIPTINDMQTIGDSGIIPSTESLNKEKFGTLMDAEKEIDDKVERVKKENNNKEISWKPMAVKHWKDISEINEKKEKEFHRLVCGVIERTRKRSVFFPSLFYRYLSKESSSKGYSGYNRFIEKNMAVRKGFIDYYVDKRYESEDPVVKPYLKPGENIIEAEMMLAVNFREGMVSTAIYCILFFGIFFFNLHRRLSKKQETLGPEFEPDEARMHFLLCENRGYMNAIFNHYRRQDNTICIENIDGRDMDPGIRLDKTTAYFCKMLDANEERAVEYLQKLGVPDLKRAKRTPEAVKKVYFACCLATHAPVIVMKAFLKQETRDFEKRVLALLPEEFSMDRTVIYLDDEVFMHKAPYTDVEVNRYLHYDVPDPLALILR